MNYIASHISAAVAFGYNKNEYYPEKTIHFIFALDISK